MKQSVYETEASNLFKEISYQYSNENQFYMNAVDDMFIKLVPELQRYRKEREEDNLLNSREFNIFSSLGYNENVLSDIIKDMLDPEGKHGQKEAFLNAFLDFVKLTKNKDIKNRTIDFIRKIQREERTEENRQIDIYIEFQDGFILVIENKIGAKDQPQQVDHYISEIEKRCNNRKQAVDFFFIYLTPGGDIPSQDSIAEQRRKTLKSEGHFTTMSYKEDIKKWLNECIDICKSERYKYFLIDMKDTILQW